MIREPCGSTRIERGETPRVAPHDVPVDPAVTNRLSPFSRRSQSERVIVACTGLSLVFANEKLAATRFVPAASIVTSRGSTSSCADAGCEPTAPMTAQRASTVPRTRPPRSTPALSGERERELSISYGAVRVNTIGKLYVPGALLALVKSGVQLVLKKACAAA